MIVINGCSDLPSRSDSVGYGVTLTFETLSADAPLRVRPWDDTLLRVIDGVIALRFDGEERLLSPAARRSSRPASTTMCAVTGEARIVMGYRRAFRFRGAQGRPRSGGGTPRELAAGRDRVDQPVPPGDELIERVPEQPAHAQVVRRVEHRQQRLRRVQRVEVRRGLHEEDPQVRRVQPEHAR